MRDLLVFLPVLIGSLAALRFPWIGVMVWTWLSIMNPHRYTWGFAHDAPLAALAAACTLVGLLATAEKQSPLKNAPARWLLVFMVWITVSWLVGLDPDKDYEQWNKVMKIDLMILVAMAVLISKQHIFALTWVAAGSLALLGAKGGVFTVLTGGSYRVWGPPGSYIEGNNEFALALAITIPLLRFLQMQLQSKWGRHLMTVVMLLCAAAALGSHSRGGLLAMSAMTLMMWWRGRSRLLGGLVIAIAAVALVAFMPEEWSSRMNTIQTYQEDRSALGRIAAWWTAWNLAFHYPFGVGFEAARESLFLQFSPYGLEFGTPVAHSIYFQVLGHHGFVGLAIFLAMWFVSYRWAGWLRTEAVKIPEARWASDLGAMCQVALIGYAVGGAFLSLAYFDLPYNLMVLIVLSRAWVEQKRWQREPIPDGRWWRRIPGLRAASEAERGEAPAGAAKSGVRG
ncbi:putative O-glycosylation ligase, exosortase A system-associated [Roseateles sp. DAIF2]|uniref:putative O-glycosylation ligase, exosortase A system-associated n=1 Tax=Roseateles sp. DAIF2 TaxID=2714952 RepID=UPI0018A25F99|nr:putative O-glycosylation ligase, exosortase A system-associated [Roseateles sp. DAIF2]QPF73698.1 putative O-glycosylation ligase, exosortase A system-associated [Roseateles sp. DAIF2]